MGGQVSAEKHHESAVVHANNVVYIHDAMKRAMQTIIGVDVASLGEKNEEAYLFAFFVKAFTLFLEDHHDIEETITFVLAVKKEPERLKPIIEKLEQEHHTLIVELKKLVDLTKDIKQDNVTLALLTEVQTIVKTIQEPLVAHFDFEVTELNSDHFEKFYTDAELLDQTNKAAKKAQELDGTIGLVFVVFNMSPQERAKFGPLPWVLKNAVFPFLASKHGKVWDKYSKYVTKSPSGWYVFETAV